MIDLGSVSYGSAALAFAVLALVLMTCWRGRLQGGLLVSVSMVSCVWAGIVAAFHAGVTWLLQSLGVVEVLRTLVWLLFLLKLLAPDGGWRSLINGRARWWIVIITGVTTAMLLLTLGPWWGGWQLCVALEIYAHSLGHVALVLIGLVLL